MSDLPLSFIVYLTAYRLATLAVGAFAIWLGYRLFVRGVWPTDGGADIDAEIAGHRFTIKNAAPGTVIALFGMAIVASMVVLSPPKLSQINEGRQQISQVELRGSTDNSPSVRTIVSANNEGRVAEENQNFSKAAQLYQEAVDMIADPINNRAWLRSQEEDDAERALPLAQLAVDLSPDHPNYIDTLAEIYANLGNREEARKWMLKAATIDPETYKKKLEEERFSVD